MASSNSPSTSAISDYKVAFLQSCLSANVLTFGTYNLKSGRQSPYFFNAGSFHNAELLDAISTAYAETIIAFLRSNPFIPHPDIIFGPAYKGIPLATSTLAKLYLLNRDSWKSVSYSFNRKEIKDHGEGGGIVGASLKGKNVLVIDDVITAGTAMRETIELVTKEGGNVIGFVVALDRMEKMPAPKEKEEGDDGQLRMSAMGQIQREYGVQTASIVTLEDLISVVKEKGKESDMKALEEYRRKYRASD